MSADNDKSFPSEQELTERVRESVHKHSLPDDIARKLRLARAEAVSSVSDQTSVRDWLMNSGKWLVPAGAASALAVTLFINQEPVAPVMPQFDEQEFAAATDMELLEDMEFLAWMLEEVDGATPDDG